MDSLSQKRNPLREFGKVILYSILTTLHFFCISQDVSRDMIKKTFSSHVMKIIVLSRSVEEEDASMTQPCLSLMGCIYSLNLSYPPKLRNTFEVFQKIFLGLDALKFSPKVNSLHRKRLMYSASWALLALIYTTYPVFFFFFLQERLFRKQLQLQLQYCLT